MTPHTDPDWNIKGCYITQIEGDPCIYNKHMIFPKPGVDFSSPDNFASIGMTVTGMPALNAIRSVVEPRAGLNHQRRPAAARLRRPVPRGVEVTERGQPVPVPAVPDGWFSVAASDELAPAQVDRSALPRPGAGRLPW